MLISIQLPDIDGYETTRFIHNEPGKPKNKVRIYAMKASVTKERVEECINSGMSDYMMKPLTPDILKEKVLKNIMARD